MLVFNVMNVCPLCKMPMPLDREEKLCKECLSKIDMVNNKLKRGYYGCRINDELALELQRTTGIKDILSLKNWPEIYYELKMAGAPMDNDSDGEHIKAIVSAVVSNMAETSNKSAGEQTVEQFLKDSNYPYLTQYDTLKCVNPATGRQLPYDFEIRELKILIEVHGEQHMKRVKYFHETNGAYECQVLRDEIKKNCAINNGYEILYIYPDDIKNNNYKVKINEVVKQQYNKLIRKN